MAVGGLGAAAAALLVGLTVCAEGQSQAAPTPSGVCERLMGCGAGDGGCPECGHWDECLDQPLGEVRRNESLDALLICASARLTGRQCERARRGPVRPLQRRLLDVFCRQHQDCARLSRNATVHLRAGWQLCLSSQFGQAGRIWALLSASCGAGSERSCAERRTAALGHCVAAAAGDVPAAIAGCGLTDAVSAPVNVHAISAPAQAPAVSAITERSPPKEKPAEPSPRHWVRLSPSRATAEAGLAAAPDDEHNSAPRLTLPPLLLLLIPHLR